MIDFDLHSLELLLCPTEYVISELIHWEVILFFNRVGTTVVTLVKWLLEGGEIVSITECRAVATTTKDCMLSLLDREILLNI